MAHDSAIPCCLSPIIIPPDAHGENIQIVEFNGDGHFLANMVALRMSIEDGKNTSMLETKSSITTKKVVILEGKVRF